MAEVTAHLLNPGPPPVWLIRLPPGEHLGPGCDLRALLRQMDPSGVLVRSYFRAVSLDRLPIVLRTGVDVEPPDSVIYAGDFEKASEYGEWPKVMSAYDPKRLRRSCQSVPCTIDPSELAALERDYPTVVRRDDGRTLWLSRLPLGDTALATPYEARWGCWIPHDARTALRAVIICVRPEDLQQLREHLGVREAGEQGDEADEA